MSLYRRHEVCAATIWSIRGCWPIRATTWTQHKTHTQLHERRTLAGSYYDGLNIVVPDDDQFTDGKPFNVQYIGKRCRSACSYQRSEVVRRLSLSTGYAWEARPKMQTRLRSAWTEWMPIMQTSTALIAEFRFLKGPQYDTACFLSCLITACHSMLSGRSWKKHLMRQWWTLCAHWRHG